MPELPEIETVCRVLEPQIKGLTIQSVAVNKPEVIAYPTTENFRKALTEQTISTITRRGKFLCFILGNGDHVVLHLRMTGCLLLTPADYPVEKHTHIVFHLSSGNELRFSDTRRFGRFWLFHKGESDTYSGIDKLGLEPFDDGLSADYLQACFGKRKKAIKECLLDQSVVAGIGNIYSDEILFAARLHPARPANTPIVERSVWEQVQEKRGKARKRKTNDGETCMFSGLLVCADCGHNLHFHFNQGNPEIKYFNCSNYKGNRGTCSSTHYVRVDFLEQVVLGEIRRLTKFASRYEAQFAEAIMGYSQKNAVSDRQAMQRELYALQARDRELDTLFEKIYEDNVSGKLSDERFSRMGRKYEDEQKELTDKIKATKAAIEKSTSQAVTADMFISIVRKYTRAKKLTPRMLNELIEKIEVHQAEKVDGVWEQRLTIHYNCIGAIDIPDVLPLPYPEVSVNTRKGVVVTYVPNTLTS